MATTSIYLDDEIKEKLAHLALVSGRSRSEVMRDLIEQAGSEDKIRLRELVTEMSQLLNAT